ncbi:hypothetical protein O6H91_07G115300 [Diphasiastrum complanatum]|uniref:Uncharacterized protein n=1 Tax=Diphasiastrum complanatum TaxID=34168 RepID=A0ACC2D8S0_DIPCM|nr:hypothetical protein O6H91_07G115300 [Diphasiastrum complanatum]
MAEQGNQQSVRKLTCLCAPTTHAGSFRCRFHRASDNHWLVPQQGPSLQQASFASKSAAKAFCEYHGSEKPARDFVKSSIPPRPPLVCKPVCAAIPRPSSLSNTVSSIGGVKKPCGKAATSTFGSKYVSARKHESCALIWIIQNKNRMDSSLWFLFCALICYVVSKIPFLTFLWIITYPAFHILLNLGLGLRAAMKGTQNFLSHLLQRVNLGSLQLGSVKAC